MSAEGWGNNGEAQFGSRNFNNSNYRGGQRREGGNGGYQSGGRPNYQSGGFGGAPRSGGYGQTSAGGGGGGGGRQYYGGSQERPQRTSFGGPAGGGNGGQPRFNQYQQSGASEKIDIESNKVGMVIGRGGGKIREIQENFNVHVKIDRDPGENGLTGVTIRGEEASIEQAKNFIQDLVAVK